jgi:uncharacterized caspase-like protein
MIPSSTLEKRIALVLVVSDYSRSGSQSLQSLPGAKNDAKRIAAALTKAGFDTELALDFDLLVMRQIVTRPSSTRRGMGCRLAAASTSFRETTQ